MYKHFFKRLLDSFIAFVVLGILFIPLVIITVWLHFANKGAGAFFFQERPGKDGKTFKIVKFKTMTDECDVNGNLLPDEMRLTKVGNLYVLQVLMNYRNSGMCWLAICPL